MLVGKRRVGDLAGEPTVLDATQDAGGHLADRVPHWPTPRGNRSHIPDPIEDPLGVGLDPVGQRFDIPGSTQRVDHISYPGLFHDDLLSTQGDLRGSL